MTKHTLTEHTSKCGICGKELTTNHPDADVYHMDCLMNLPSLKAYREEHKDDPVEPMKGDH